LLHQQLLNRSIQQILSIFERVKEQIAESNQDSYQQFNQGQQSNWDSHQQSNQKGNVGTVHVAGKAYINFQI